MRGFTQDDGHVFCTPDQIRGEIREVLELFRDTLTAFGFAEYEVNLSTKPDKSVGSDDLWQRAEEALQAALSDLGWPYKVRG